MIFCTDLSYIAVVEGRECAPLNKVGVSSLMGDDIYFCGDPRKSRASISFSKLNSPNAGCAAFVAGASSGNLSASVPFCSCPMAPWSSQVCCFVRHNCVVLTRFSCLLCV